EKAIRHALAINSDDRFPTLEEFWQAVSAHPSGIVPSTSVADSVGPSTPQPVVTPFVQLPAVATPRVSVYRQRRIHATQKRYAIALSLVAVAMLALLASFTLRASF